MFKIPFRMHVAVFSIHQRLHPSPVPKARRVTTKFTERGLGHSRSSTMSLFHRTQRNFHSFSI